MWGMGVLAIDPGIEYEDPFLAIPAAIPTGKTDDEGNKM